LIPVGDLAGVAEALGAPDAAVAVAEALAAPALEGLDRPDVVGQATLRSSNGQLQARKFKGTSDSLRPNLNPAPSWENVPFDSQLRLEVTVSDDDLLGTEPIGTFIVNAEALREAARKNEVYQLRLAEQTSNTLLFVGLIVNSLE
ncbi:MAG TPA: hypothetical protein VLC09_12740, partial [Polyangiaceae bacterium]|nr:hypothetical protein [Polyangiaceae bacterium]